MATRAIGQEGAIGSTIQDACTGSPLPGATVQVKGTTRSTTADASGQFRITAAPAQTLVISMIGMKAQQILVENQTTITVRLEQNADTQLNEVVVTALGIRQEKRVLGYSVGEVKGQTW